MGHTLNIYFKKQETFKFYFLLQLEDFFNHTIIRFCIRIGVHFSFLLYSDRIRASSDGFKAKIVG